MWDVYLSGAAPSDWVACVALGGATLLTGLPVWGPGVRANSRRNIRLLFTYVNGCKSLQNGRRYRMNGEIYVIALWCPNRGDRTGEYMRGRLIIGGYPSMTNS